MVGLQIDYSNNDRMLKWESFWRNNKKVIFSRWFKTFAPPLETAEIDVKVFIIINNIHKNISWTSIFLFLQAKPQILENIKPSVSHINDDRLIFVVLIAVERYTTFHDTYLMNGHRWKRILGNIINILFCNCWLPL
jgi:hypothetical protein